MNKRRRGRYWVDTCYGLSPELTASIIALAQKHDLDRLILFGSRARGDYRPRSDVDLAALGGDISRFALDVDEQTPTLLMFDVVDLGRDVQPELLLEIERDGIVLYEKA